MYLRINGVNKSYAEKYILNDINVKLRKGEITVLLGPNGAGKTTLMNIIVGLLNADSGSIYIDEKEIKIPYTGEEKRHFFYLPDEPVVMEYLTGFENMEYMCEIYRKKLSKNELKAIMAEVELEKASEKLVKDYSRGMKQRLCLAYLRIYQPDIILLDEPTIGLDVLGIEELITFLKKLRSEGKAIMISSHDISFCSRCADKTVVINSGKILNIDNTKNLIQKYTSIENAIIELVDKENRNEQCDYS